MKKPKIITLSGSTRFIEHFAVTAWILEKEGNIVLGCHLLPKSYFESQGKPISESHLADDEGVKDVMDELHLKKIDISDWVFVLNVGGYIGESTRNEIDYALSKGKLV